MAGVGCGICKDPLSIQVSIQFYLLIIQILLKMTKAFYFPTKQTLRTVLYTLSCFIFLCATQSTQAQTTWTIRSSAADNGWRSVTYGNGLFVAVANSGTGNRVMTSPDGITWTARTSAADNSWHSVTYGNGLFVAVAQTGTGNRVMTSPDGITWTTRTSAADFSWNSVTYGNGLFVALDNSGSSNSLMTSPDGITWTTRTSAANNGWSSVTYGNGLFVAVASSGTGNRVMTSPDAPLPVELLDFKGTPSVSGNLLTWQTANEVNNKGFEIERLNGNDWQNIGFKTANNKEGTYNFIDHNPLSTSYYRLRQIDNDGKETLSKVVSVSRSPSTKLKVYPNPVSNVLTVETDFVLAGNEANTFQIYNLLGQQVLHGKAPFGGWGLDVSALPQGTYFLKVGMAQVKFMKQ